MLQALTIVLDSANAFALFLKSQRKWSSPPLANGSISLFKSRLKEYGYATRFILPHGSYLINLGNPDACVAVFFHAYIRFTYRFCYFASAKREKSYECFIDDLKRCEQLGLELYNFQ